MGYYIRILGAQDPDIHADTLMDALRKDGLSGKLLISEDEQPDNWTIIQVANENGDALAQIERNPVRNGELGQDELDEFRDDIQHYKPLSAVRWLHKYFDSVKVIYAFQLLNAAFEDNNFAIISSVKSKIWNNTGGIFQADQEGFSNEDGYHILWQFADTVSGEWQCAVLNDKGQWDRFSMDLGDQRQRQEFWSGLVPSKTIRNKSFFTFFRWRKNKK